MKLQILFILISVKLVFSKHKIVMGGSNYDGTSDFIPDECAEDTAIRGKASGKSGNDIAVRCCALDGSNGVSENIPGGDASNKGCLMTATYHVAKAACQQMGRRLCTSQELGNDVARGSGCGHDARQAWTSESCGTHVIVVGAQTNVDEKPDECAVDTATSGVASNSYGNDIGIQCCNLDGSGANRYCQQGVTFDAAEAKCEENGRRLCTAQEVRNDIGKNKGCSHSHRHVWTSTSCGAHDIVAGGSSFSGDKPVECASNSATTGVASNSYGNDIGVQCCKQDGSSGYRTNIPGGDASNSGCLQGVGYDVALAACSAMNDRLCTKQEVESNVGQGSGCSHNARHVWTSNQCGAHEIVVGSTLWVSHSSGDKPVECAEDSATTGVGSNNYGNDIGVQCCKQDGSNAYRENLPGSTANKGCLTGVNYNVAYAACTANGDRLCTKAEVQSNIGKGKGCDHDARHVWTSETCPPTTVGTPKPTPQPTPLPTTPKPTPKPTLKPTKNPTPSPTAQPTPAPTENPTKKPTYFTASPTPSPTFRPTYNTPSPTPSPTTANPTPSPTNNPTPSPSGNPTPSPTPAPTGDPTPAPTGNPTPAPTDYPTPAPTDYPTPSPTDHPTPTPTTYPTPSPTDYPTASPTPAPTGNPTPSPTDNPTPAPTDYPTPAPTDYPTPTPTGDPTPAPTNDPTPAPTDYPTAAPTDYPTPAPTEYPTPTPTDNPTPAPTNNPTTSPTDYPTPAPTDYPTPAPTGYPTTSPTPAPTDNPSPAPSFSPTMDGCDFDVRGYLDQCYCLDNASVDGNNIDINGMSKHRGVMYLSLIANILVFSYVVYANSDYYNRKKRVYKYVDVGMNSDTEQIALKQ